MKVAIASMGDRVCGRLDCASELVVVDVEAGEGFPSEHVDIRDWPARGRAARVRQLGVGVLVCGAVCRFDAAGVDQAGLRLIAGVSGPIDRVVEAALAGTLGANDEYWGEDSAPRRRRCHRGGGPADGGGRRRNRSGGRTRETNSEDTEA